MIRNAEWLIRKVDHVGGGGGGRQQNYALHVTGVSEIVRDVEAVFLTEIENDPRYRPQRQEQGVVVLDPVDTELIADGSPQYRDTRFYLEGLLRQAPPVDDDLHIGHLAAIDRAPYQFDPAVMALGKPRCRILLADAVGLGKTVEVGILLSELIRRGRARRILVVAVKSMMTQFQKELWYRFAIPLVRLDSDGIQRIRRHIPTNANPFQYYDRSIISIDTLKQDTEYRSYIEQCKWDVIVIDEAHNVAERGGARSQRARLAKLLAGRSDTLIMASATPHDGKARSFASLMNMLDPTAIANPGDYKPDDIRGLFLRRFKKDIRHQVEGAFRDRRVFKFAATATPEEERLFDALAGLTFKRLDRQKRKGQHLFRTILEKSIFSSPAAFLKSVDERVRKLAADPDPDAAHDAGELARLRELAGAISPDRFSKYQRLLEAIRDDGPQGMNFTGRAFDDRLVIFTERIETMHFLYERLRADLGLSEAQACVMHGQMGDAELQRIVDDFGQEKSKLRLIVASDVASEGINLHYYCCKMFHFDIPWSLMKFQQRNGRIDRYGQEREPRIVYLMTATENRKVRGDARYCELLIERDRQAQENIGDPSAFLGVYDEEAEELKIGDAIERGLTVEQFEAELSQEPKEDFLALLFADAPETSVSPDALAHCRPPVSLYGSDLEYVKEGLTRVGDAGSLNLREDPEHAGLSVDFTDAIAWAFDRLPREIRPRDRRLHLTADPEHMKREVRRSRKYETSKLDPHDHENSWLDLHYLWPLHPLVEWLNRKAMVTFPRHQAPVVRLPGVPAGESWFLMSGQLPNLSGRIVLERWFAVRHLGEDRFDTLDFEAFLEKTNLHRDTFANPRAAVDLPRLSTLKQKVIDLARKQMETYMRKRDGAVLTELEDRLERLNELEDRHLGQLELEFGADEKLTVQTLSRKQQRKAEINEMFRELNDYFDSTLKTENQAYLRLNAVFLG